MTARFRADLLRQEAAAVSDLTDTYDLAAVAISEKLSGLLDSIGEAQAAGEAVNEAWLTQEQRYRDLLQQIEDRLREFSEAAAPPLIDAQRGFVASAVSTAPALARAAIGPAPNPSVKLTWNALPQSTLDTLVGFAGDGGPLHALLEAIGPAAAAGVKASLIAGVAAGIGPNEIAASVQSAMNTSRARAVNIARTETMRAARQASIDSYAANADVVDGWTWLASCDGRTCAACWAMHGTTHPNTESLDGHCQCRCVPAPLTKSWGEILGDDTIEDTRPQITPGVELFEGLSEAEQKEVLGPALHALYTSGDVTLPQMVTQTSDERFGTMRRPATVQEAQANARA